MRNLDEWDRHYAKRLADATKLSASLKERARLQVNGRINAVRDMIHGSQTDFLREHARMRGDLDAYIAQLERGNSGVQERDTKQDEWCEQAGPLTFILQKSEPMYIRYDRAGRSGSLSGWIRIDTDVVNSSMQGTYRVDHALREGDQKPAFALKIDPRFQGTFTIAQGQNRFQLDTRTAAEQYALRLKKVEEPVQETVAAEPAVESKSAQVAEPISKPAPAQPAESRSTETPAEGEADDAVEAAQREAVLAQTAAAEATEKEAAFNRGFEAIQEIVKKLPVELQKDIAPLVAEASDLKKPMEERIKIVDKISKRITTLLEDNKG